MDTNTLLNNLLPREKQHIIDKIIRSLQHNRSLWEKWIIYKSKERAVLLQGGKPDEQIPRNQFKSAISIGDDNNYDYFFHLKYKPFGGHLSRLGHYYRHLYQLIKIIDEFNNDDIDDKDLHLDKKSYARIVRAQLSSNEQLLLFYNSLSHIGEGWLRNNYLKDYRLLKNIPLPLANLGKNPIDIFGRFDDKGEKLFQWDMED